MRWQDVCGDKNLADLPYKIELNRWGQIVLSPADYQHSSLQFFNAQGEINNSVLCPDFPRRLSWFA